MDKWRSIIQQGFRDAVLMFFGGWVIWTQVYAKNPNGYLILVGFGCMVPSARAAILSVLREPGSPSDSVQQAGPRHRKSSSSEEGDEDD